MAKRGSCLRPAGEPGMVGMLWLAGLGLHAASSTPWRAQHEPTSPQRLVYA